MSDEDKVIAAIKKLGVGAELPMSTTTRLRDDLGLDSANLIELTVLVHEMCGIDLGRRAAERNLMPNTIGDLVLLMRAS
jgi:acyl carrier protein